MIYLLKLTTVINGSQVLSFKTFRFVFRVPLSSIKKRIAIRGTVYIHVFICMYLYMYVVIGDIFILLGAF